MTQAVAESGRKSIVTIEERGRRHEFGAAELPVTLGSAHDADVVLEGVTGSIQIGRFKEEFFVQAGRGARNLRIGGEPLTGTRELRDGDVIAFDRARLECRIADGRCSLCASSWIVTAGDTAPPDLDQLARNRSRAAGRRDHADRVQARRSEQGGGQSRPEPYDDLRRDAGPRCLPSSRGSRSRRSPWRSTSSRRRPASACRAPCSSCKIGDRFLLRPGSHRVAAELPGYYPLDTEIDVGSLSDQTIALTLTKLPGIVTLTTEPEVGAEVQVDGVAIGKTPLVDVEITPGVHQLELAAERYLSAARELDVAGAGERQALAVTLTPDWAVVSLNTAPPGATVLVDGAEAGITPAAIEIMSGEHDVEVRLAGYNAWTSKVLVEADRPQQLPDVTLTQADGRLEVASNPSEATVSVDGEFRGRTPLSIRLSPGRTHRLALSKPGYETATRELSVAADSGRRLQIDLTAQYGEIEVASTPPAEVWVDGQRRGSTPLTLALTAVSHVIEVRQAGFATQREELTPRPGFPQKLAVTLAQLDAVLGRRLRGRSAHERAPGAQARAGRAIHDGLVAARGRPTLERAAAPDAPHARVLSRRARGHERRVPRVQAGSRLRRVRGQFAERRRSARGERELGRRGSVSELAQRQRRPPARLRGRARRLGARSAAAQRLSFADGRRMGVGRAVRGPDGRPALPVGRASCRRRIVRATMPTSSAAQILRDDARHLQRRLPVSAPIGSYRRQRLRHLRPRRQRRRMGAGLSMRSTCWSRRSASTIRSAPTAGNCTSCAARAGAARP